MYLMSDEEQSKRAHYSLSIAGCDASDVQSSRQPFHQVLTPTVSHGVQATIANSKRRSQQAEVVSCDCANQIYSLNTA